LHSAIFCLWLVERMVRGKGRWLSFCIHGSQRLLVRNGYVTYLLIPVVQ
jgi:hypothetical protein